MLRKRKVRLNLHMRNQVVHQAGAYLQFIHSMKQLVLYDKWNCDLDKVKAQWLEHSNRYSGSSWIRLPLGKSENLFPSIWLESTSTLIFTSSKSQFLLSFVHIYHLGIFEPCSLAGHVSDIRTQYMTSLTTYSSVVREFQPVFWKVMGSTPVGELGNLFPSINLTWEHFYIHFN